MSYHNDVVAMGRESSAPGDQGAMGLFPVVAHLEPDALAESEIFPADFCIKTFPYPGEGTPS